MKKILITFCLLISTFQATHAQAVYNKTIRCNTSNSLATYVISTGEPCGLTNARDMIIANWTSMGDNYIWRQYLKFDLTSIPSSAIIDSAFISLFADTLSTSGYTGSPTYGSGNESKIYRLTQSWDTTSLVWSNQPTYTTTDFVTLSQSISTRQDYINVNITNIVRGMASADGNFGIMMKHKTEGVSYNSMIFYSPSYYNIDSTKVPTIYIKYHFPTVVQEISNIDVEVYPNPVNSDYISINILKKLSDEVTFVLSDVTGKQVALPFSSNETSLKIPRGNISKGIYVLKVHSGNEIKNILLNFE